MSHRVTAILLGSVFAPITSDDRPASAVGIVDRRTKPRRRGTAKLCRNVHQFRCASIPISRRRRLLGDRINHAAVPPNATIGQRLAQLFDARFGDVSLSEIQFPQFRESLEMANVVVTDEAIR